MFKVSRKGEDGETTEEAVAQYTGPISSTSSSAVAYGVGPVLMPTPGADPPPGYSKTNLELVIKDGEDDPDRRTELHRAKSKRLIQSMVPSSLEEIGSTTWVKKVNSLAIVMNWRSVPNLAKDAVILDHLVRHKKVTVLIHDLILVVIWRNEILSKLIEIKQEEVRGQGSCSTFSESTIYMVINHAYNLAKLTVALLTRPEILLSLGPDLHDLIDYAVGELRHFIENKPARDPALDKPGVKGNSSLAECGGLGYEQQCSHASHSMGILFAIIDDKVMDKLPTDALLKLIHPDTKYIITLVDMVLTRPASYAKRKYGISKCRPDLPDLNLRRNRRGRVPLNSFEAGSWCLIHSVFIYDAPRLPVAATSQMTQECYDKVMLLRPLLQKERLLKAMPELEELQKFLHQLASTPPKLIPNGQQPEVQVGTSGASAAPPSPNFVKIRSEAESNRDAIVRIHSAMGTFEDGSMPDACRRMTRDNYCLFPLYDMNNPCFYCAKTDAGLVCSRCQYARYCKKKCQSKDWATHKLICSR